MNMSDKGRVDLDTAILSRIPTPGYDELKQTFEIVSKAHYLDIPGVIHIDSGRPGPTAGIAMCTHGNEPSGIAPLWFALANDFLKNELACGSILFFVNNLRAAQESFGSQSYEQRYTKRFIDINMNRLPSNCMADNDVKGYEAARVRQLRPVYDLLDAALDIHSTSLDADPIILEIKDMNWELVRGFPITNVITNICAVQVGVPAGYFYGGDKAIPVFEIETGFHENPVAYQRAIVCMLALCSNLGLLRRPIDWPTTERVEYRACGSVIFPDGSYELVKVFKDFEAVASGETLATGNLDPITCPRDGHAIFGTPKKRPASLKEEALFLTEPAIPHSC